MSDNGRRTVIRRARVARIKAIFQERRKVKGQELADAFEVSVRTIYRDIGDLVATGMPIAGFSGDGFTLLEGPKHG